MSRSVALLICQIFILARDPSEPIVTANGIHSLPQIPPGFNMQTAMRQAYAQAAVQAVAPSTPPEDTP